MISVYQYKISKLESGVYSVSRLDGKKMDDGYKSVAVLFGSIEDAHDFIQKLRDDQADQAAWQDEAGERILGC